MVSVVDVEEGRGALVRSVLLDLPEWFGRPASLEEYARSADSLPTLAAQLPDGRNVGFLCLKRQSPVATEAFVLGIMRQWHRRGYGGALFREAERRLVAQGVRYLTVKTL